MPEVLFNSLRREGRRPGLVSHSVIAFTVFGLTTAVSTTAIRAQDATPQVAQEGAPVTLPPVNVEGQTPNDYKREAVTSPKITTPLVDTPKTITVIPKEVIQDRGATSLMDVLRTVPGISLGAGEGGIPSGDRAFIRGFDSRGDTFVDGSRDPGVTIRDPFNYEQIEITKGPGSAYTGRGSTGGSINLVSKTPQAEDFRLGSLTLGTDMTKRLTLDINEALDENTAFRLNLMGHDAEVAGRDAVEQSRLGFAPSLTLGLNGPTQLTLSYFHLETEGITDYGHPFDPVTGKPVAVDRDNFYGLKNRDNQETSADIVTARVDHRFNDNVSLRNQTRYGVTTNDYITTLPSLTAAPAGQVIRNTRSRDETVETISNQTDLTWKFSTGSVGHTLVTGVELSRENFDNKGRTIAAAPNADRDNPDPNQSFTSSVVFSGNNTNSTTDTLAVYAFDTVKLSEQWEVTGGARLDQVDTEVRSGAPAVDRSRDDTLLSWQGGVVYKPAPNGSVYVSYGTSYNPSAEFGNLNDATVNLEPEKNNSYEVGTKWDLFSNRLALTGAVFRTEKTNARVDDASGTTTVLDGETQVDGIEIGLSGSITDAWKVFGGYTYLKSEIVDDGPLDTNEGHEVPGIAPHNLSLWTTYQIDRKWNVGGGALYTGKRFANTANTQSADSYWRFDAMVGHQLTETVDLRLNFLNLTDEVYYDGLQSGRANIAPGRTVLLTADVKF